MSSSEQEMLSEGLAALRAGDKSTAQSLLREVVKLNPRLIEAWLGLAQTTTDPVRQRTCYENILKIDPDHAAARAALATLGASASDIESPADGDTMGDVGSLRPKITPVSGSMGFKPPQNIPGAPARFSLDDLMDFMKNLMASLQGTAGRGGNEAALPASWWNIVVMVVVAGVTVGFISVLAGLIAHIIKGGSLSAGNIIALITFPLLTPLEMGAGLAGGTILSRWFLQWRGKAEGNFLDHTMALAVPWFAGAIALLVLSLIGAILGSGNTVTLESVLRSFQLLLSGTDMLMLILRVIVAIGVVYLTSLGWAKLYPESKGSNRIIAAILALFVISLAVF